MKRKDIKKQPGYNWTEIANEVHIFVGCDASHPAMKQDHIWVEKNSFHMQIAAETYMAELGQLMWLILPISSIVPCHFGHPLSKSTGVYWHEFKDGIDQISRDSVIPLCFGCNFF
jgi:hypothetical protein